MFAATAAMASVFMNVPGFLAPPGPTLKYLNDSKDRVSSAGM